MKHAPAAPAFENCEPRLLMADLSYLPDMNIPEVPPLPGLNGSNPITSRSGLSVSWEGQMLALGNHYGNVQDILNTPTPILDYDGNVWYYDGERVFYQMMLYTGDKKWYDSAQAVEAIYRPHALALWAPDRARGYSQFAKGLAMDYLFTGDVISKQAVDTLRDYNPTIVNGMPNLYSTDLSRETAYVVDDDLMAMAIGEAMPNNYIAALGYARSHLQQWYVDLTSTSNKQTFMAGLTMEALIGSYEQSQDPSLVTLIKATADWLWNNWWFDYDQSFRYSYEGNYGAPILNYLVLPTWGWLWRVTGETKYQVQGDQIFAGGLKVLADYPLGEVYTGKQFSQNYRWSFDYIQYRTDVKLASSSDTTAPAISNVADSAMPNVTSTNGNRFITWNTDEASDSVVEYGRTTAYTQTTPLNPYKVTNHLQILGNVAPNWLYHYRVKSTDSQGNVSYSQDYTFRIAGSDTTGPMIDNITPTGNGMQDGTISVWKNQTFSGLFLDDTAVAGVTWRLGSYALGSEVTTAPYSLTYNTSSIPDEYYTLTVTARDTLNHSTSLTFNNVLHMSARHGDMNGDGPINGQDIYGFVQALGNPAAYQAANPMRKAYLSGDMNGDNQCNGQDIIWFLNALKIG